MNKEQLDAIKERVAKATPGEWIGDYSGVETTHKDFQKVSGGVYGEHNTICNTFDGEYIENSNAIHDSRFIAHARQDVPALIAEVERLQKALKNTDADLYVYKDLYNDMTDKNIELIKFLQARITKGWGQKAVDLAMIHIQEQEKDIERLRERVALDFFRCGETTTAFVESVEENKRLQKQHDALEFHLKVSSKALESEGAKADKFQRALEKIYDELGDMYEKNQALTCHRVLEIVCDIESALDGEPSLRDDDDE